MPIFLCGRCCMVWFNTRGWVLNFNAILPLCCIHNGASFAKYKRSSPLRHLTVAIACSWSKVDDWADWFTFGAEERSFSWLLRKVKCCGKLAYLFICSLLFGEFGLREIIGFLERWRDLVRMFGRGLGLMPPSGHRLIDSFVIEIMVWFCGLKSQSHFVVTYWVPLAFSFFGGLSFGMPCICFIILQKSLSPLPLNPNVFSWWVMIISGCNQSYEAASRIHDLWRPL